MRATTKWSSGAPIPLGPLPYQYYAHDISVGASSRCGISSAIPAIDTHYVPWHHGPARFCLCMEASKPIRTAF